MWHEGNEKRGLVLQNLEVGSLFFCWRWRAAGWLGLATVPFSCGVVPSRHDSGGFRRPDQTARSDGEL